jgi:glycosyltransferase involved in cell wall biosynthesis
MPYPPQQGAAIRNWHLIAGLAARDHDVDLLTFGSGEEEVPEPLSDACRRVAVVPLPRRQLRDRMRTLALTRLPDMARRLWSPAFAQRLSAMLAEERYDWVQVEGIEMAPYAHEILTTGARAERPRWLFDEHNAEYLLQQRAFQADLTASGRLPIAGYSLVQWQRLRRYELAACRAADAVVTVSDADRAALLSLDPGLPVTVVPNGVDLDEWDLRVAGRDRDADRLNAVGPLVVFDGTMDFRPNVDAVIWFVREIWPLIRRDVPLAQFAIVGRNPTARVRALEGERGVVVTGAVPDTRPWVATAAVYVVPIRVGGGVRLKVLQALAMQRPLVSTRLGCEGITVTDDVDVLLADDAATFAWAVTHLLRQPERARELGRAARRLAALYSWDRIVPQLEAVLMSGEGQVASSE